MTTVAAAQLGSLDDAVAWAGSLGTAAAEWPAEERHRVLAALDRGITALSTARSALLVAERQAETWKGHGDPTFDAWVSRTTGSGQRAAAGQVRRAEMLDRARRKSGCPRADPDDAFGEIVEHR